MEEHQAKMAHQVEAAHWWEEAERHRVIKEAQAWMEWEQQEEMQAWVWAVMVMQGGGTPGPLTVVAGPTPRVCERGKAQACLPCQKARKVCVWPLGLAEATVVMGSGKPVPKHMVKWRMRTTTNALPQGGEKHKKVHMTMEEGEDDEDTKEVFGVPRVMAEEQCDMLGMLTQVLAQVADRLAAVEAHNEERLTMEQERMEIRRAHLVITRRAADWDKERLELEWVRTSLGQQRTEDLWWMGTLMQSPFVYLSKGEKKEVEMEVEAEKGEEADDEDKDAQGEEE